VTPRQLRNRLFRNCSVGKRKGQNLHGQEIASG
jgi:hypothetical protein